MPCRDGRRIAFATFARRKMETGPRRDCSCTSAQLARCYSSGILARHRVASVRRINSRFCSLGLIPFTYTKVGKTPMSWMGSHGVGLGAGSAPAGLRRRVARWTAGGVAIAAARAAGMMAAPAASAVATIPVPCSMTALTPRSRWLRSNSILVLVSRLRLPPRPALPTITRNLTIIGSNDTITALPGQLHDAAPTTAPNVRSTTSASGMRSATTGILERGRDPQHRRRHAEPEQRHVLRQRGPRRRRDLQRHLAPR